MTNFRLDQFLSGHVFAFLFIFARIGSLMMLFPGIGESYVSPRIRLMFALTLTFLLLEPLYGRVPVPPAAIGDMVSLLAYETVIGLFFGTLIRLLLDVLESAGSVIALQTGLSNATILNPTLAIQSPLISAMLSVAGVTLLFISGLDHLLFRGLSQTYNVFPAGGAFMPGDMAQTVMQLMNRSFVLGIELALPFLIMGLLMNVALGILQRLLPQVQLFLVVLPAQIWGGLALMGLTVSTILAYWLEYFDQSVTTMLGGG